MPTMKAAVVRAKHGPFSLEDVELEEPRDNEVLVRITGVGLCHTDLAVRDQHMPVPLPAVLGHEGAGIVERVGRHVTGFVPGDPVVMSYASCGTCPNCQRGLNAYCPEIFPRNLSGGRLDGSSPHRDARGERIHGCFCAQSSFAEYALAPEDSLVKLPRDVPVHLMGPLGCSMQTGAGAILNALRPEPGSSLVIFGLGSVGLSALMAARVAGCAPLIAVDLLESRLALARELGATHCLSAREGDVVERVRALTGGEGTQYSLDCTGAPGVVRQAVESLRLTGVCGIIGLMPMGTEFTLDMNTVLHGRTLRGIVEGDSVPRRFIPRLVELWREGRFPLERLIQTWPLSRIDEAARASARGEVLKAVLMPGA
ncbi:NAD(P)-dependent alcohol dehydrogenase [Melittangium boletus]|uniref:Alcohol dehydrogenase n=1 Tax=Melittangium boletus DSM 14713 TaxID=1294270 RepID=A0A250IF99_9BACT|nr:NAD(P)-dependent alcohol dehydrogenase [Melittangium boletus]ATB29827.1 alcohol dehydrogenase [Melittangium boletus DSM 14713]